MSWWEGMFKPVQTAIDVTVGTWWSQAHDQAGDMRTINRVARHRRDHPQSDTYIEVAQRHFKPIDAPREGTRDDVRNTNFHGTAVEKRHWWEVF